MINLTGDGGRAIDPALSLFSDKSEALKGVSRRSKQACATITVDRLLRTIGDTEQ